MWITFIGSANIQCWNTYSPASLNSQKKILYKILERSVLSLCSRQILARLHYINSPFVMDKQALWVVKIKWNKIMKQRKREKPTDGRTQNINLDLYMLLTLSVPLDDLPLSRHLSFLFEYLSPGQHHFPLHVWP